MSTSHDLGITDADHLALAVENWASGQSRQPETVLENREHAYGHVKVFENVLNRGLMRLATRPASSPGWERRALVRRKSSGAAGCSCHATRT